MGSMLENPVIPLAIAAGVAAPMLFPTLAGAGAAAGGGLAGTGLGAGAAIPLAGIGPGGIGAASIGGSVFPAMGAGLGASYTMPNAYLSRVLGGIDNNKQMMSMGKNLLARQEETDQSSQMAGLPPPPPPFSNPQGGYLAQGGGPVSQAMSNTPQYHTPAPTSFGGGYEYG